MRKITAIPYYAKSAGVIALNVRPLAQAPRLLLRGEGEPVTVRVGGTPMQVRGFMELWSVKEQLIDDFYGRHGLALQEGWNVIDIGAAIGEFTIHALLAGAAHTIAVDPAGNSLDLLRSNLALNGLSNAPVTIRHAAVVARERLMAQAAENQGMISGERIAVEATADDPNAVPGVTLASLINELPGRTCDLLKLDCEGAEFEIILETPDADFAAVRRIVMEYHERIGRNVREIQTALERRGYTVVVEEGPVHRGLGYLYASR